MKKLSRSRLVLMATGLVGLLGWLLYQTSQAQLGERPGHSGNNPIDYPRDLSGLSIKNPRIRIVHTTDPKKRGGSMYLQAIDPWLGYRWGWSLTQREFRARDGVYGDAGKLDGLLLPDGATRMMSRSHVNSCGMCHNTPYRDGGAGATIAKNGGQGRNTPHLYGAGLIEMIGMEMRLRALAIADANRDGWITMEEANGKRCKISTHSNGIQGQATEIDYGSYEDKDNDGRPDLNPVFNPIFVDKEGKRIPFARNLNFPGVAGYTFEVQMFGFGHLYMPFRSPASNTLRSFIATPFDIHSGMQPCDPTTLEDPDGDGFAGMSNAGAMQCVTTIGKDRGAVRGKTGISHDDPDRDGYCEEISEGDLDVVEWYLLNHPKPGRGEIDEDVKAGQKLFSEIGCAKCHVPEWQLKAINGDARDYTNRTTGDRRFFDLEVTYNTTTERLEGKLTYLASKDNGIWKRHRKAVTVRDFYSDLKYHDLGPKYYQMQFDGTVIKKWRTSPLWGVGSTAPYDHDGASLTLHDAIRRHGGEAEESQKKYSDLPRADRKKILAFLRSLVLYQTDQLPCDLNGDGKISEHFKVAGQDTGIERFNPEWLFNIPGKIEGPIENVQGEKINSFALTNVIKAYGLDLEYLKDSDEDGFPDIIDPAPNTPGYRNGEK